MSDVPQQETATEPRVTAIVASYNNVEALRRCLTALEQSKQRDTLEIIAVDKGSRDGSQQIDSEFPGVTPLRLPRNFGSTKAFNIAMRTARAELVFLLEPEVEVAPDTIVRLADYLDSDSDAAAVCPITGAEQFYRLPTSGIDLHPVEIDMSAQTVAVESANFTAMMVRKYFIRGLNYLDEKFGETWSDVDLCFQIRRAGRKIIALPGVKVNYTPREERFPDSALTLLEADRVHGAARFCGKYAGFFSGLMVPIKAAFSALFSFRFGLLTAIVSGRKVDGTQHEL